MSLFDEKLGDELGLSPEQLALREAAIESAICAYTNNNFFNRNKKLIASSNNEKLLGVSKYMAVGDRLFIMNSGNIDDSKLILNNVNVGKYDITAIADEYMQLDKNLYDAHYNKCFKVEYPADVILGCQLLLEWEVDNGRKNLGVASESISRHSVSYTARNKDNLIEGYPFELMQFLEPYVKARF